MPPLDGDGVEVVADKVIKLEKKNMQGTPGLSVLQGKKIVLGHHNRSQESLFIVKSDDTLAIINHRYQKDTEVFSYSPEQRP